MILFHAFSYYVIVFGIFSCLPPCKTESRAIESKLIGLEISTEVTAKLYVLEAVNTSSESRRNSNGTGDNAERLCHCTVQVPLQMAPAPRHSDYAGYYVGFTVLG